MFRVDLMLDLKMLMVKIGSKDCFYVRLHALIKTSALDISSV